MNKDLEEAIKILNDKKDALNRHIKNYHEQDCETLLCKYLIEEKQAIKIVLNYIENSISKEELRKEIIDKMKNLWVDTCAEDSGKYTAYKNILNLVERK